MAKKHVMSFADQNLLNAVVTPEVLVPLSAKMSDYMDGLADWKSNVRQIDQLSRLGNRFGFTPGRDLQHVARIPSPVRAAVLQVMPDAFTDKKQFYALLDGPLKAYDVRGKIIL